MKRLMILAAFFLAVRCDGPASLPTIPEDAGIKIRMVGTITNAQTQATISGATVTVTQGTKSETSTSFQNGGYLILSGDLRTGDVAVRVTATGFNEYSATVHVVEGTENTLNIALTPA